MLPKICYFTGMAISGYFTLLMIADIYALLFNNGLLDAAHKTESTYRLVTVPFGIFYGLVIASLFPNIQVEGSHIHFVYLGIFGVRILGKEIDGFVQVTRKTSLFRNAFATTINPETIKTHPRKFLLLATLHGLIIGRFGPVILLSPSMENEIDEIKRWIGTHRIAAR